MPRRVELLDTSVVLELLRVPFESDRHDETIAILENREADGVQFQLPVAAIVEAGAHVGRINNGHLRRECAARFDLMIKSTLAREVPWTFVSLQWDEKLLQELVSPTDTRVQPLRSYLETQQLEMGDALIVSEYRQLRDSLNRAVVDVDVWTYDAGLRAVIDALRGPRPHP